MKKAKSKSKKINIKGYSLIELLLAMALFSLLAGAIIFLVLGSFNSNRRSQLMTEAKGYLQESNEAVRSIAADAFNKLPAGTYGLSYSTTNKEWSLASAPDDPDGTGSFISRTVTIEDVNRDSNGDIGGSNNDPYTRKVSVDLSWDVGDGGTSSLSSENYLTAWQGDDWTQTDWSDGSYDSTDGNLDVTSTPGQVTLNEIASTYNKNWDFNTATDYTLSDSSKIEITGGVAQLKKSGGTPVATQNQGMEVGIGSQPNFWGTVSLSYARWYRTGGYGDNKRYISNLLPRNRRTTLSNYWMQSITLPANNMKPSVFTFKWYAKQYSGTPTSVLFFVNIDTGSGAPDYTQAVWSQAVTGTGGWQTATINPLNIAAKTSTAGTYYIKLGLRAVYGSGYSGPFEVGIDNIDLQWTKDSYPTDLPYVENATSWEPEGLGMIDSFAETSTKDINTAIYYQLSNDNGATWYYYDTTAKEWRSTSSTNGNEASDVNDYIKYFPVGEKKIKFRAYLSSDGGNHQVQLDNILLTYNPNAVAMEVGQIDLTQSWQTFNLANTYDSNGPVVTATLWEKNNTDTPVSVRIRNITENTFEARLEAPLDNFAPVNATYSESVDYLAVEDGAWILDNDTHTRIEAQRFNTDNCTGSDVVTYDLDYDSQPIFLHQLMSANDTRWITTWGANTAASAEIGLEAAEATGACPQTSEETVGYIIIEDVGTDNIGGNEFSTYIASDIAGHDDGCFSAGTYYTTPLAIGSLSNKTDTDGGWLVRCGATANDVSFHVEEDQDADTERGHSTESTSSIILQQSFNVDGRTVLPTYQTSGYLISNAIQATSNFNILTWDTADSCTGCSIKMQIRTANTEADLASATWSSEYTDQSGVLLDLGNLNKTWAQYRVELNGDGNHSPILREIILNYY
jgi:prepilin-type N-terminal cleavage/methylation domain-containing protein